MSETETIPVQDVEKSRLPTCLALGCGFVVLGLAGLFVAGWWLFGRARELGAELAYDTLAEGLEEIGIEGEERASILVELARLRDGVKDGRVGLRELEEFLDSLSKGPFFPSAAVVATEKLVLEPSELTEEEKVEASIHLQRVARGLAEGVITRDEALSVLEPIDQSDDPDDFRIEDRPSLEDVRAMVAAAKTKANQHEIPVEPFEVDLAAELRQAVDSAFE